MVSPFHTPDTFSKRVEVFSAGVVQLFLSCSEQNRLKQQIFLYEDM